MARPEMPIDYTVREVGNLAAHLRTRRAAAGLTYAELAAYTLCSAATLKRAARGGTRPPEWTTVREYVRACGAPEDEARALYVRAHEAAAIAVRTARRSAVVPKPQLVRDLADLSGALRDAYRRAGSPPVREMERRAGPGRLSHSTAHAIITARGLPKDVRTYIAFLESCEISGSSLIPWFAAWAKVRDRGSRQPVFLASTLRPNELLLIEWFIRNFPLPSDGRSGLVLDLIDGPRRLDAEGARPRTAGGEVRIAA
ncbi:helix-turn-helix domain-containing protein [Streptomyces purpurogeneiscleroticus]|uniref:helix-turn-helix domain-containing protein n=1 Tax=Streptomyces purpurogeneiscleroticus TaxID=68259 RepID=UPI001CC0A002|nr:helix-turn-helix transcriptional regulator [Streptomyces purpurogeneiscleroticus]MBZ4016272.1 hypothetical protein [Streptomyces purpurogeneiscleroticus]